MKVNIDFGEPCVSSHSVHGTRRNLRLCDKEGSASSMNRVVPIETAESTVKEIRVMYSLHGARKVCSTR